MTLTEWLESRPEDTVVTLKSIGVVDGVPNVATVSGRRKQPIANAPMNSWTWCIPLHEGSQDLLGCDNADLDEQCPLVFVWGPSWFEYTDESTIHTR